jgi:hypothetical protein
MVQKRNIYRVLMQKHKIRRIFERPRRRWKESIKTGLKEIGWED